MPKVLMVTLQIDVDNLSEDRLEEMASDMDVPVEELPDLDDIEATAMARPFTNGYAEFWEQLFEGSDLAQTFTDVAVVSAHWMGDKPDG